MSNTNAEEWTIYPTFNPANTFSANTAINALAWTVGGGVAGYLINPALIEPSAILGGGGYLAVVAYNKGIAGIVSDGVEAAAGGILGTVQAIGDGLKDSVDPINKLNPFYDDTTITKGSLSPTEFIAKYKIPLPIAITEFVKATNHHPNNNWVEFYAWCDHRYLKDKEFGITRLSASAFLAKYNVPEFVAILAYQSSTGKHNATDDLGTFYAWCAKKYLSDPYVTPNGAKGVSGGGGSGGPKQHRLGDPYTS
jgi:hypothetical protein